MSTAPNPESYHAGGCGYRYGSPAHAWACLGAPLPAAQTVELPEPPPEPEPAPAAPFTATTAQVRAWAKAAGLTVSARGRVPGALLDQYAAAH